MKNILFVCTLLLSALAFSQEKDVIDGITIIPVEHASFVLKTDTKTIFIDPVKYTDKFNSYGSPDIIIITDIHGDHLSNETLEKLSLEKTMLVVPQAVEEKLSENLKSKAVIIANGEKQEVAGITIKAVPMYNLREEAKTFHTKGRGNGYIISLNDKRIYVSGDTEDIPEMRKLNNIDIAFVCMNLPYTMTEDKAAEAVLDFKPKVVYPYHYRGQNGKSDIEKFKQLVNKGNDKILVKFLTWYP